MFSPLLVISIHEVFADLDTGTTGIWRSNTNFNPRGLRRPRLICRRLPQFPGFISIHEVFADLDEHALYHSIRYNQFQSTRSSQTSTWPPGSVPHDFQISIHEVFADLDSILAARPETRRDFNPRGLRRPRLSSIYSTISDKIF